MYRETQYITEQMNPFPTTNCRERIHTLRHICRKALCFRENCWRGQGWRWTEEKVTGGGSWKKFKLFKRRSQFRLSFSDQASRHSSLLWFSGSLLSPDFFCQQILLNRNFFGRNNRLQTCFAIKEEQTEVGSTSQVEIKGCICIAASCSCRYNNTRTSVN